MQKDLENCLLWRKTVPRGRKLCQLILQQFPHKTWLWEGKKKKIPPVFLSSRWIMVFECSIAAQQDYPPIHLSIHPSTQLKEMTMHLLHSNWSVTKCKCSCFIIQLCRTYPHHLSLFPVFSQPLYPENENPTAQNLGQKMGCSKLD